MEAIQTSLAGLVSFILYFAVALGMLLVFKFLYVRVTPYDEWELVKEQRNVAAATGFVGAILGFAIALSGALSNSQSLIDFAVWAVVALIAQVVAFAIVRFVFIPGITQRINDNELSAGIVLAGVSVAVGLLNAASMTY